MFSMTKLRDNSKVILWTLLFFFVASMTVGGLVGGANIITTIQGLFGKVNTNLYVGKVDDENISIQHYITERQKQINRFRQQGRNIDSRAIQNAGDFAWNNIVDRVIKDKKIKEFNLKVQDDEIFDFLLLSPPPSFQDNLKSLGLYTDENNNFLLEEYQNAITFGTLPDTTNQLLFLWENYLREYLSDRKLQNLYKNSASITNQEIETNYKINNLNCTIDLLSININNINDSLIIINEEDIKTTYNKEKKEKYLIEERVVLEYVFWDNIDQTDLDSLDIIDLQDSLLQLSIDFSTESEITSFNNSLETYNVQVKDTITVTENFRNNSGFPFQMGSVRTGVRFAFDNAIGTTSEQIITDNGIAVFHIIDKLSEDFTDIKEVQNNIERTLKKDQKLKYAKSILNDLDILNTKWENLAQNDENIELTLDESSTLNGNFKTIGRSNELPGELLKLNINDVSEILTSSSHVFVLKLKAKDDFIESDFIAIKDSMKNQLLIGKRNQIYNDWLRAEKDKVDIIDLRHKIF